MATPKVLPIEKPALTMDELKMMTNNFGQMSLIGEGSKTLPLTFFETFPTSPLSLSQSSLRISLLLSFSMKTNFAPKAELLHCLPSSTIPSLQKPHFFEPNISKPIFPKSSFSLVSSTARGATKRGSLVMNWSKSSDGGASLSYKEAEVDIDAGAELVRRIAKMAPNIGGFGGLFPRGDGYLVSGTDGVGTKLKLAFETGIHETIGIDLYNLDSAVHFVAMSVNDIVTSGTKPLFFLDYFATGRLVVDLAEKVVKGIVEGCKMLDCVLLGGETAEMPGFYPDGEYEISGFVVGDVKKDSVIDGKNIAAGDVLIGLPSSGVHSNGFSLVRRVLSRSGLSLNDKLPGAHITLSDALMAPTVIYVKQVFDIISKGGVKGIAHITGGGFTDNIPRVFPDDIEAVIYKDSWDVPPVFKWLQEENDQFLGSF